MWTRFRSFFLAVLVTGFYKSIGRLWRYDEVRRQDRPDDPTPKIFAHWHGDELALIGRFADRGLAVMISRSLDGQMLDLIVRWLGYRVVRGSSSRGGAGGLKGLIDLVRGGASASLAVDGPRGPIYVVKPGVIKLAQETGAAIYPGAVSASRRYVFERAWNRCFLPWPFSKCVIVYGRPMRVPADLAEAQFESFRLQLQDQMMLLKKEAEEYFQTPSKVAESATLHSKNVDGV